MQDRDNAVAESPAPRMVSKAFCWTLVILCVVLPAILLLTARAITSGSLTDKTRTIINTIRVGLELTLASKGEMIPLDYSYVRERFAHLETFAELRTLQAIDDSRRCFIDAWGRPLVIRLGPHQQFQVVSSGPDGLWGTADDLGG